MKTVTVWPSALSGAGVAEAAADRSDTELINAVPVSVAVAGELTAVEAGEADDGSMVEDVASSRTRGQRIPQPEKVNETSLSCN